LNFSKTLFFKLEVRYNGHEGRVRAKQHSRGTQVAVMSIIR